MEADLRTVLSGYGIVFRRGKCRAKDLALPHEKPGTVQNRNDDEQPPSQQADDYIGQEQHYERGNTAKEVRQAGGLGISASWVRIHTAQHGTDLLCGADYATESKFSQVTYSSEGSVAWDLVARD